MIDESSWPWERAYPSYLNMQGIWCIAFLGMRSILYNTDNEMMTFETEKEALEFIDKRGRQWTYDEVKKNLELK